MIIRDAVYNAVRQPIGGIGGLAQRFAYNMDGIDDRFVLTNRAINVDGDNTFEFWSPDNRPGIAQMIISQNVSETSTNREFNLFASAAYALQIIYGGTQSTLCLALEGFEANKKYWLSLTGTNYSLSKDSQNNVIKSGSFVRGAAREPAAPTIIGARGAGAGLYTTYFQGIQRDIKINGVLWKMDQRNQAVQTSIPAGNNMTGTNLNPDRWTEIPL